MISQSASRVNFSAFLPSYRLMSSRDLPLPFPLSLPPCLHTLQSRSLVSSFTFLLPLHFILPRIAFALHLTSLHLTSLCFCCLLLDLGPSLFLSSVLHILISSPLALSLFATCIIHRSLELFLLHTPLPRSFPLHSNPVIYIHHFLPLSFFGLTTPPPPVL